MVPSARSCSPGGADPSLAPVWPRRGRQRGGRSLPCSLPPPPPDAVRTRVPATPHVPSGQQPGSPRSYPTPFRPQKPSVEGMEPRRVTAGSPQQADTPSLAAALRETILATGIGAGRRWRGCADCFSLLRGGRGKGTKPLFPAWGCLHLSVGEQRERGMRPSPTRRGLDPAPGSAPLRGQGHGSLWGRRAGPCRGSHRPVPGLARAAGARAESPAAALGPDVPAGRLPAPAASCLFSVGPGAARLSVRPSVRGDLWQPNRLEVKPGSLGTSLPPARAQRH